MAAASVGFKLSLSWHASLEGELYALKNFPGGGSSRVVPNFFCRISDARRKSMKSSSALIRDGVDWLRKELVLNSFADFSVGAQETEMLRRIGRLLPSVFVG